MHVPTKTKTKLYSPPGFGSIDKRLSLRRRSSSMMNEEESDPDWVTKPRLDSPRLHSPLPVHSLVWHSSEECLYTTGAVFDISGGRATY